MRLKPVVFLAATGLSLALGACGGGDGSGSTSAGSSGASGLSAPATVNQSATPALASGAITGFGSVFVQGIEWDTAHAAIIDDDTGTPWTASAVLEAGMYADVIAGPGHDGSAPEASALHLHPLARGYVDASDTTGSTLQVMGQTVQLSASTLFSDHRACLKAATPCTAITGQGGLAATSGGTPGSYVTVHGYLFNPGSGTSNAIASLVSVNDLPSPAYSNSFKAEGEVSVGSGTITIGSLTIDAASTTCYGDQGASASCSSIFTSGNVVSVMAGNSPGLPATNFSPAIARLRPHLPVQTAGGTVALEGPVTHAAGSSFMLRGITIDLPDSNTNNLSVPADGDLVQVVGTLGSDGMSLTASQITILHAVLSQTYGFVGDASAPSCTGSSPVTCTLSLLGQTIRVNANTRLADRSVAHWDQTDPAANPLNITTFVSYLSATSSKHLRVETIADASGNLTAITLTILPSSAVSAIEGPVDASPAPSDSAFGIHGVAVSAEAGTVIEPNGRAATSVSAGDLVVAIGSYASGTLTVTPPVSDEGVVVDYGAPPSSDRPSH
jgi:Domain of unknown function (DUF5666)